MAVISEVKGTKIVLDLVKGTQTISKVNASATDTEAMKLANAVATLQEYEVEKVKKVVETTLVMA